MRIHVNFLIFIYMVLLSAFVYGGGINKDLFKKEDVIYIKQALVENNLKLKNDGSFLDFKTYRPTREFLVNKIRDEGVVYIFPDRRFYIYFLTYLDDVLAVIDSSSLKNKEIEYKDTDGKVYLFMIEPNDTTIHVNVFSPVDIEDFPYSESSYMYHFERIDGVVVLSKINVAG